MKPHLNNQYFLIIFLTFNVCLDWVKSRKLTDLLESMHSIFWINQRFIPLTIRPIRLSRMITEIIELVIQAGPLLAIKPKRPMPRSYLLTK